MSNAIVVLDHQLRGEADSRDRLNGCAGKLKTASTLGDVLAGVNKAPKEVKIGSFIRGSSPTIPGKINGTPTAITIDAGAEDS